MTKNVLVYIEIDANKVARVSKEIISHALSNFSDSDINGVVIADEKTINLALDDLKNCGVKKLYILNDNLFDTHSTCLFSGVLERFILENKPDILLIGATPDGRDLAPRLASKLNIGLTADCTDLQIDDDGKLLATRPTYGGKMMATIISKTVPDFATVRPGAFKYNEQLVCSEPEIVCINPDISGLSSLMEIISSENKPKTEDWTCAEIIVAGGLGLKTKENFDLIYKLAELLKAKPAASRAVVEQGWAPQKIQVGQTGNSISPKLYIAFGISGAMQHTVGITNSDKIIAVNTDIDAPIMHLADFAIQDDAVNVINSLIQKLSN